MDTPDDIAAAGAVLTIDLDAIAANWRDLRDRVAPARCAAVVKADAYGLGADRVAPVLQAAGCDLFFVAHVGEGVALRRSVQAEIRVLHGPPPGTEAAFVAHGLVPVLNSAAQVAAWRGAGGGPAVLQIDTGMGRLGLPPEQLEALDRGGIAWRGVMSHLACADTPEHPANRAQLAAFRAVCEAVDAPASLAASFGLMLGRDWHFDLVRPGAALYGVAPPPGARPTRPVLRLQARVIQCRTVPAGTAVGYGLSWTAQRPTRVATVGLGYADGLPRAHANRGAFRCGGRALPLIGRVSMDSITLDATDAPEVDEGALVDVIGPGRSLDEAARDAGTIGYELLATLGGRFHRRYAAVP